MADRIPLIVNPSASQIQELPAQDKLLLSGHLEFVSTNGACGDIISTGGSDANFGIYNSTSVSNNSMISIIGRNNANNGYVAVASFAVGASNKIELDCKGEITAVQPACLLTVPKNYTANNSDHSSTAHSGGTNNKPISFTNTTTNVNCTTSLASNATVNSGISSITVPSAGTYLVSACISGQKASGSGTDQIRFALAKSGISTVPNAETFPTFVFGDDGSGGNGAEFNATFTLPLTLSASDILSVHFSHIGSTSADIQDGYFSVVKLH